MKLLPIILVGFLFVGCTTAAIEPIRQAPVVTIVQSPRVLTPAEKEFEADYKRNYIDATLPFDYVRAASNSESYVGVKVFFDGVVTGVRDSSSETDSQTSYVITNGNSNDPVHVTKYGPPNTIKVGDRITVFGTVTENLIIEGGSRVVPRVKAVYINKS